MTTQDRPEIPEQPPGGDGRPDQALESGVGLVSDAAPIVGAPNQWQVVDRAGAALGEVGLGRPSPDGSAELDVWLLPQSRGRGVIQAALDLLLPIAFGPADAGGLGLRRLTARCESGQRPSERALRRAGFRRIGTTHGTAVRSVGGAPVLADEDLFELLATDDRAAQRIEPLRIPLLESPRLRLRAWRESDRPDPADDPDEAALSFMPPGAQATHDDFDEWLTRNRRYVDRAESISWCIADRDTDRALGSIAVFTRGEGPIDADAEIGYWAFVRARGAGVLTEALTAVTEYCFRPTDRGGLGLVRLHADTDARNTASQALLRAAGWREWGHARGDYANPDGTRGDSTYFEMLASDEPVTSGPGARLREPTLEGRRVRLRRWADRDRPRIVEACRDPLTRLWLFPVAQDYDDTNAANYLAECRAGARNGSTLPLAIADPVTDELIGSISVMGVHQPLGSGEIGYWTHPAARGRGVMTEALALVVRHAFAPVESGGLGLHRLALRVADGNAASARVATANGFTRQGTQRSARLLGDGTLVDLQDYDLLATEFDPRADG